jgi:hypothetical protein
MIPRPVAAQHLARTALLRATSAYPSKALLNARRCLINAKQSSWREGQQQQRLYSGSATAAQSEKVRPLAKQ